MLPTGNKWYWRQISKNNNLSFYYRKLKKENQIKPQICREIEIIRIMKEFYKIENKKSIDNINETKSQFFEMTNKIDKPLAKLTK